MKRKVLVLFVCILLLMAMSITASADMGPKPSVQIDFTGTSGETYYVTLLSKDKESGPYFAWSGYASDTPSEQSDYDIWKKFVDYRDSDGFYFLQMWGDCTMTDAFIWDYYPPSTFKILLYFPERDAFYVSPIYERYAFSSYYTVDLSSPEVTPLQAETNYDYTGELISLVVRILLTIAIEMGIASWCGYREKKLRKLLIIVNAATQIILNVLLNITAYYQGALIFAIVYILLELLVMIVEAIVYAILIPRFSDQYRSRGAAACYAIVANLLSFAAGLLLAYVIPGLF